MSDKDKDSCNYSVEIGKQFLTLASAAIAFLVALATTKDAPVNCMFYATCMLFILSVGVGLLYVMSVVGHIQKDGNYNVYTPQLRILGALQIVGFLVGVVLLVVITVTDLRAKNASQKNRADLEVTIKDKLIRHTVSPGDTVKLTVSEQGVIDLQVTKTPMKTP